MAPRRAVVLLSGGLDSAVTLAWAVRQGYAAHALTVDYGQRHREELRRAADLARRLGASEHRVVRADIDAGRASALTSPEVQVPKDRPDPSAAGGIPATYVPARNTVLLALALSMAEGIGAEAVVIGANAVDYSGYPDCRPEFLDAFQEVARLGTRTGVEGRPVRVEAPLIQKSKAEIVRLALELGVDPSWTWSCYDPTPEGEPCGRCDACRLRARGFEEAGLPDLSGRDL